MRLLVEEVAVDALGPEAATRRSQRARSCLERGEFGLERLGLGVVFQPWP